MFKYTDLGLTSMQSYGEVYPRTAYLLGLIGGVLMLVFTLIAAAVVAAFAGVISSIAPAAGAVVGLAVALLVIEALIFGGLVIFLSLRMKSNPQGAKGYGVIVLVLSVISLIAGGNGFYIGAILALIGGILAIIWRAPTPAPGYGQPMMGQPMTQAAQPPAWGAPPPATAPPPGAAGGKFCSSCGSQNAPGAQFCAKCGAPIPA